MTLLLLFFGIVLATFISEDGALLWAASVSHMHGNFEVAVLACFFGIWLGDLGLYYVGRAAGRQKSVQRFLPAAVFQRPEKWFQQHGSATVLVSRFVPGTRLPTYLAAGVLRMPAKRFAVTTGWCSALWVAAILYATRWAGSFVKSAFPRVGVILSALLSLAILALLLLLFRKFSAPLLRQTSLFVKKYSRWEFWPAWIFYPPVICMCVWLGIKYRGFTLPAMANPGQKNGGIVGESKSELLRQLMAVAPEHTAEAYLLASDGVQQRLQSLRLLCAEHRLRIPFVLKPEVAQRGAGFKKITSWAEAEAYLAKVTAPVVVQRYSSGQREAGIFYYRYPDQVRGTIFSITEKQFPLVIGDGEHTLEELVNSDPRMSLIAETYLRRFSPLRNSVLPAGERIRLVEAGNHCQGCVFRDGWHLYSEALREKIDAISQAVPGFFVGRYDVRYNSDEDLRAGRGFEIIELNGAASEATHIYDERNTLWSAYRTLYQQWELVYSIGNEVRARGGRRISIGDLLSDWGDYRRLSASYPMAD